MYEAVHEAALASEGRVIHARNRGIGLLPDAVWRPFEPDAPVGVL